MDFDELWAARPYWPFESTDKEQAEYYFNHGIEYQKNLEENKTETTDKVSVDKEK